MKKRIIVEHGEVKRIALLMNCTYEMVSHSLAYRKDTKLAKAIRKMALTRGGVEVGDEPVNDTSHEEEFVKTVWRWICLVAHPYRKRKAVCRLLPAQFTLMGGIDGRQFDLGDVLGSIELRQFRAADKKSADRQTGRF